jgi:hypothetical protein
MTKIKIFDIIVFVIIFILILLLIWINLGENNKTENFTNNQEEIKYTNPYNISNPQNKQISIASVNSPYTQISDKSVKYPDYDLILQYGDMKIGSEQYYKQEEPEKNLEIKSEIMEEKMANLSLIMDDYNAYKHLLKNKDNVITNFEPINLEEDEDIAENFRKIQNFIKTSMDDPIMRGSNIRKYNNVSKITDIGKIDLINSKNYPEPEEYIFESSPIFKK